MSKDINDNDNKNEENEEYFQDEETNNFNGIEANKNNNYNLINKITMSGEEYNNQEFYENQDNDIHELDVDLNDINNEYNLENMNNIDERIDYINNEIDGNFNGEIGYPNSEMNNLNVNMGDDNNYINHNNNGSTNSMNMENIDEENINNSKDIINNNGYYDDMNNIVNFNEKNNRIINQNMNNNSRNYLNNMLNNNEALNGELLEEDNDIHDSKLKLIYNIKDINEHFIIIENKFKKVEKENLKLKNELENENKKNKQILINNSQSIENFKKQGNILLDDIKNKNNQLISKINDLESKNNLLNYQLIEANQNLEKLKNELSKNKNDDNDYNDNNNKKNVDNNFSNEIKSLKNKIYENEIIISKLNYDKKKMVEKNENLKKEYIQKTNYIISYKNNEINLLKKEIKNYRMFLENNNTNTNNNNISFNENIKDKNCWVELANKEKIINGLILKINTLKRKFKNCLEVSQFSYKNNEELQMQIQELVNDKNELIIQNQNNKIKLYQVISIIKNSVNTLRQYKYKNNALKQKIFELNGIINRLKNKNHFICKNYGISYIPKHQSPTNKSSKILFNTTNNF